MNRRNQKHCTSLWQLAAWAGLLVYACAFTPVGMGLAAIAGSLDRNHVVLLESCSSGSRLVLHHRTNGTPHRHGLMARALTLFATPSATGQSNHVLQFNNPEIAVLKQLRLAPTPPAAPQPEFLILETLPPLSRDCFSACYPTHSSPEPSGPLPVLRSTLLLI